jgi:hypothetical protein
MRYARRRIVLLVIAAIFSQALLNTGCSSSKRRIEKEWYRASQLDTRTAYESFLSKYPMSSQASRAKLKIGQLAIDSSWARALEADTISAYESFLDSFPLTEHTVECVSVLWKRYLQEDWRYARSMHSIQGYREFLGIHPFSAFRDSALQFIETLCDNPLLTVLRNQCATEGDNRVKENSGGKQKFVCCIRLFGADFVGEPTYMLWKNESLRLTKKSVGRQPLVLDASCSVPRLSLTLPFEGCLLMIDSSKMRDSAALWRDVSDVQLAFLKGLWKFNQVFQPEVTGVIVPDALLPDKNSRPNSWLDRSITAAGNVTRPQDLQLACSTTDLTPRMERLMSLLQQRIEIVDQSSCDATVFTILTIDHPTLWSALDSPAPKIIHSLVKCLSSTDDSVCVRAFDILSKHEQFVPDNILSIVRADLLAHHQSESIDHYIVRQMSDWDKGKAYVDILLGKGWQPSSLVDSVLMAVAKRDRTTLARLHPGSTDILFGLLSHEKAGPKIKGCVYSIIAIGNEDNYSRLDSILIATGTREMAEVYLNSGSDELKMCAWRWASNHGLTIETGQGANDVRWGEFR